MSLDELAPLHEVLLRRAGAEAEAIRAASQEQAAALLAAAQERADEITADARRRGEEDATVLLERDRADARRAARDVVLHARADLYEELRAQACAAVAELLAETGARARLTERLRAELGAGCEVQDSPDGGLVASSPDGRRVDASVEALVATALPRMDLEGLWST